MKLTPSYWKALQYADQALDIIEKNAVAAFGRKPSKRSVQEQMVEHKFEEMKVDTLVVLGTVQAGRINGVDTKNPIYESIHAGKVYVSEEYKEEPRIQKSHCWRICQCKSWNWRADLTKSTGPDCRTRLSSARVAMYSSLRLPLSWKIWIPRQSK